MVGDNYLMQISNFHQFFIYFSPGTYQSKYGVAYNKSLNLAFVLIFGLRLNQHLCQNKYSEDG
jgi:hypothetical protein